MFKQNAKNEDLAELTKTIMEARAKRAELRKKRAEEELKKQLKKLAEKGNFTANQEEDEASDLLVDLEITDRQPLLGESS